MPFGFGNEITEALLPLPRKHINVWKITAKASALKLKRNIYYMHS
jgi:hypothetical protein